VTEVIFTYLFELSLMGLAQMAVPLGLLITADSYQKEVPSEE